LVLATHVLLQTRRYAGKSAPGPRIGSARWYVYRTACRAVRRQARSGTTATMS